MLRHHIPKLKITSPSEISVPSDKRPYMPSHNESARQGSPFHNVPVNSKTAHSPPPPGNPRAFDSRKAPYSGEFGPKWGPPGGAFDFRTNTSVSGRKQKDFRVIALVDSTWVFLLLSFYIVVSWNLPLLVWSEDKLNKKFVVAENFVKLVSKGKRFCLYSFIS